MNGNSVFQNKLILFLIIAILILCMGFIFISCGTDPQLKITDPDKGQYALDFSNCDGTFCRVIIPLSQASSSSNPISDIPLTAEAWVKVKSTSTTGSIMGRIGGVGGISLLVNNNIPSFLIRSGASSTGPTSTEHIVTSGTSLIQDVWTHIAGVLSSTVHSHPVTAFCANGIGAQTPHLDIYVDGAFSGCKTTNSEYAAADLQSMGVGVHGESGVTLPEGISGDTSFNGLIDEVRIWGIERSESEIQECMNQELGTSGTCDRSSNLSGYSRLNEGQGDVINDWSGLGAGVMLPPLEDWSGGWTLDAAPITRAD